MADAPQTLDPEQQERFTRLAEIFLPYGTARSRDRYPKREGTARFVHYTSAEAAFNIIESKRFWMRNAMCMADYGEVIHGYEMLRNAQSQLSAMIDAVEDCQPNAANEPFARFREAWEREIRTSTYVACLSEHESDEDFYGRLSMWRAMGSGTPRVAIVLNIPWFSGVTNVLKLVFSPVAYMMQADVCAHLERITASVGVNKDFLRTCPLPEVQGFFSTMLLTGVTCMKHAGFREEREWRAIHGPHPLVEPLMMKQYTRCIDDVPQLVYEIPLDAAEWPAVADLDLARILDRVIIGPSQYPVPMAQAFIGALARAKVPDPASKVFISDIPIRT